MPARPVFFWKKAPFIRAFIAFSIGIVLQWQFQLQVLVCWISVAVIIPCIAFFSFTPLFTRYRFSFFTGILLGLLFTCLGALTAWHHDIRHHENWFGNFYTGEEIVFVTLDEPPVEKNRSFKALARVKGLFTGGRLLEAKGRIILYFKKDSCIQQLKYGSRLLLHKGLQEIKNSGNPGGFDYKRYCLFQGITHQVYLVPHEFGIKNSRHNNKLASLLYRVREKVLTILRQYIKGEKETGLAEALLIGYKDDLDKNLLQSYSNTGVVHVIAISGLHLGLIYWILHILTYPLRLYKNLKWLRPLLILCGLWSFSLLAGAQPSVLRSAIMFSCLVIAGSLDKKTFILNSLALSAFVLVCINPYWLWDLGFQLSYAAVLSLVLFMRPVYNLIYCSNKLLDLAWKMNAITLAAQILTFPLIIYHFHQFPNYFLVTNFLAVPLSSIILAGEILLFCLSAFPFIATLLGNILSWLINRMNSFVETIERMPFALWEAIQVNAAQTVLLFFLAATLSHFLLEKSKAGLKWSLLGLGVFFGLRSYSLILAERQERIIIYNTPKKTAIDFIRGRSYYFFGDSLWNEDEVGQAFYLRPARTLYRLRDSSSIPGLRFHLPAIVCQSKHILFMDETTNRVPANVGQPIDLLVISGNPPLSPVDLTRKYPVKQVVFDSKVTPRKRDYWKKECDSLGIPYHDVTSHGAFVMKLR